MSQATRARGPVVAAALALLAVVLPACGGSGGGGTNAPTNVPPPPVRTLVVQGGFSLVSVADANRSGLPADVWRHEFTTSGTGALEVNADWTFGGSQMVVAVVRGACSFQQIYADACAEVIGAFPAAKPTRLTANGVAGGTYTLVVLNANNYAESGTYQVFLTR